MPSKSALALSLASTLFSSLTLADQSAIGDDGREILLKDNGHWEYRNNDRLATSDDGTRVRLQDDGSWQFIGNAPVQAADQVRTETLDIQLREVITEEYKAKVGKGTRYQSQTIFYFDVKVSSYGEAITGRLDSFERFKAIDDKGTQYPVISVKSIAGSWAPGSEHTVSVRVDGSPSGSIRIGEKKITLSIDKEVFGSASDLSFSLRTDDIKKKKVGKFE